MWFVPRVIHFRICSSGSIRGDAEALLQLLYVAIFVLPISHHCSNLALACRCVYDADSSESGLVGEAKVKRLAELLAVQKQWQIVEVRFVVRLLFVWFIVCSVWYCSLVD